MLSQNNLFLQIILAAKWFVQHSSKSPNHRIYPSSVTISETGLRNIVVAQSILLMIMFQKKDLQKVLTPADELAAQVSVRL